MRVRADLDDLLADELIQLVMRADGVDPATVRSMMGRVARARDFGAPRPSRRRIMVMHLFSHRLTLSAVRAKRYLGSAMCPCG